MDEAESIQVRRLPLRALAAELRRLEDEGVLPITGLHMFALGIELGRDMTLT